MTLLRSLYRENAWRDCINGSIHTRLGLIQKLHSATLGSEIPLTGRNQTKPRKPETRQWKSESGGTKSDVVKSSTMKSKLGKRKADEDSDRPNTRSSGQESDSTKEKSPDGGRRGSPRDEEPQGEKKPTDTRDKKEQKSLGDGKKEADSKTKVTTTQEKKDENEDDKTEKELKYTKDTGL